MIKRGKVLRDTTSGPGLLMIEGQQYRFSLEDVWKSEAPPKPGRVVDVELDACGKIQSITAVPDSQLVREQAEALALTRVKGPNLTTSLVPRIELSNLVAAGLLLVAWFFLTAIAVQVPFPGKDEFTFWQLLGLLNAGNISELLDGSRSPNTGFYGLAALVALTGPFIHHFWKDRRALLGGWLPLLFMMIVGIAVRGSIQSALAVSNAGPYTEAAKQARDQSMKAISLGPGTYLSILAGLYFAFASARAFLVSKGSEGQELESTRRKAA